MGSAAFLELAHLMEGKCCVQLDGRCCGSHERLETIRSLVACLTLEEILFLRIKAHLKILDARKPREGR